MTSFMKPITLNVIAAPAAMMTLVKTALLTGVLMAFAPAVVMAAPLEKKGSTSYTSHYVFHPLGTVDVSGVGKVTALEMVGTTENTKGEPAFDKLKAKCFAVNVETGGKKWIDGACAMTDSDGDVVVLELRYARSRQVAAENGLWDPSHHRRHRQVPGYHRDRAICLRYGGHTGW